MTRRLPVLSHRSQLLRPLHMWLLGACLPPRCVERPWKKLFSMTKHGQSFARFMARVVFKGPTILVVRGEAGHVFGCYASQSWHKSNKFYGDMTTFVFSVAPVFRIFRASNVNNHFQWLSTRRRARSDFRPEKQHTLGRGGRSKRALRAALPLYAKCWTELLDGGGAQPDVVPQRARRGGAEGPLGASPRPRPRDRDVPRAVLHVRLLLLPLSLPRSPLSKPPRRVKTPPDPPPLRFPHCTNPHAP